MPSLDGTFWPFDDVPGFSQMAPCMRSCDHTLSFNGCDSSPCWCKKGNLDLRMSSMTGCASKLCTFANMDTQTDIDILSAVQLQYCIDKNASPAGMALPSKTDANPTSGPGITTGSSTSRRTSSGPINTGGSSTDNAPPPTSALSSPPSSETSAAANNNNNNNGGSSGLSTAVKSGIGVGVAFCALLAVLIVVLLFRRRKPAPQHYPPPSYAAGNDVFIPPPPPNMSATPYSGNGPFSPPSIQQPAPVYAYKHQANVNNMADVSPVSEKAVPVATAAAAGASTPKVLRKEVKSPSNSQMPATPSTPGPLPASTAAASHQADGPREILGDVPGPRHEVSNDAQITNTVSIHGMELDSNQQPVNQYPGQPQYQQSAQGYPYYNQNQNVSHEVEAGQAGWGQRQELPAQGMQSSWGAPPPQGQGYQGGPQYGHAYEMPGR